MLRRVVVAILAICAPAAAQNPTITLRASGAISGEEAYTVTRNASGTLVAGHTSLSQNATGIEYQYKISLAPDCSLQKYEADIRFRGAAHKVSAERVGDQVKMAADAQEKSIAYTDSVALLDNSIMAEFQLLATCFGKTTQRQLMFLVPQTLGSISGNLIKGELESGTLNGQPVRMQRYTLTVATVSVDFWIDGSTGDLLRVANTGQNFFATREGLVLTEKPAAPAAAVNYVERDVKFSSADLQFPGTLCLPKDARGKVPLVVLVHGSGPHDRDETVGPNKPFAEIAHALASAGIATLRYDKRTYAFALQLKANTITLDQEVTDDAVAGLTFAATQPEVDSARLFLLGHSLGGTMAPYIAQRYPKLKGVILLAAGARPIDQIIAEQIRFQLKHEGKSEAEIQEALKNQEERIAEMRKAPSTQVFNGIPAGYMRDWLARDPAKLLRASSIPTLVLQGGSDLQVSVADYELLKAAIAGKPNSEARLFPNLTHLFSVAPLNQTFDDIRKPAHVDPEVTSTIAEWIKKLK
jgi:dienelactone hydrolase